MELDELKQVWVEHNRKLDQSIRLSQQLLKEKYGNRARFALWRLSAVLALGAIVLLALIVSLGQFIAVNWTPRFAIPAIALDAAAITSLAALVAQIVMALHIDYDQPVAAVQKRLESLRKLRIRYIQAIFLFATLLWMPAFIVVMKVFLRVDVFHSFPTSWIVLNVGFGLLVLAIGYWLARRYGARMTNSAFGHRLLRDLAGYNLNAATRFLSRIEEFERDYSSQERSNIREYSPEE